MTETAPYRAPGLLENWREIRKIDAHMHVNGGPFNWGWGDNDDIIAAADALGIDQMMCSIPITCGVLATPEQVREANDGVIESMKKYPGRILGYAFIQPGYHHAMLDEIEASRAFSSFLGAMRGQDRLQSVDHLLQAHPVRADLDRVGSANQWADRPAGIFAVSTLLGFEHCVERGRLALCSQIAQPPLGTLLRGGGEKELAGCVGENDRTLIAALGHDAPADGRLSLQADQPISHRLVVGRMASDGRNLR